MQLVQSSLEQLSNFYRHGLFWQLLLAGLAVTLYILYYIRFREPHFFFKANYETNKKNIGRPPPPYPNGWYTIMQAHKLKKGEVKNVDIVGQNMVVYRGEDGIVYALEAYCLHMGAHLGVGGQVVNASCIQCPFHGWLYDGKSGHCVDHDGRSLQLKSVQYNAALCERDGKIQWKAGAAEKVKLRKFPVSQINGYIYVWIHAMEEYYENPIYPLVNIQRFIKGLQYRAKTEHHTMCHIQEISENGADLLHFKYVHTYITPMVKSLFFKWKPDWKRGDDPDLPSLFESPRKYIRDFRQRILKEAIQPFPRKQFLSIASLDNEISLPIFGKWFMFSAIVIQIGLSISFVILKSPFYELVFHGYVQPHGKAFHKIYHDCYISWWVPYAFSSLATYLQGGQIANDMNIWSSKKFARKAYLMDKTESDQYLKNWRAWSTQHYQGCEYQLKEDGLSW